MHSRPSGRYRRTRRFASISIAAAPLPAFAADLAVSPWGTYLFFAIVATVVIVLLLHEALGDDENEARRRDDRRREFGMPSAGSGFSNDAGHDGDRRAA